MFVVSQYLLNVSGMCKNSQQISTYSIALGLILYSSIYLYILFYNNEYLSIFNKFIIYIVIVDLLLSAFYYFNLQGKSSNPELLLKGVGNDDADEDTDIDTDTDDEDEYIDEDVDDVSQDDEELDQESQDFINNLITQARISDQERMSKLINEEKEKNVEEVPVLEKSDTVKETQNDEQIENIIDEVITKKKPAKRAPKKKVTTLESVVESTLE